MPAACSAAGIASGLILLFTLLVACQPEAPDHARVTGNTMGTSYSLTLPGCSNQSCNTSIRRSVEARLASLNAEMSTYDSQSRISQFNRSDSTDWFAVSADFINVVALAADVSANSAGALDVTIAPVLRLWGFGPEADLAASDIAPDAASLSSALAVSGYQKLGFRRWPPAIRKHRPALEIDLSALAKGYAVDQLAELLETSGYSDYLVEIGGEMRLAGHSARGAKWSVGIDNPALGYSRSDAAKTGLAPGDAGLATSGDYRNFRMQHGVRLHHIIDPRDGRPASHRLASVTVVAETAMLADAWATALMVLGKSDGLRLAQQHGIRAYFIVRGDDGFETAYSRGFDAMLITR